MPKTSYSELKEMQRLALEQRELEQAELERQFKQNEELVDSDSRPRLPQA